MEIWKPHLHVVDLLQAAEARRLLETDRFRSRNGAHDGWRHIMTQGEEAESWITRLLYNSNLRHFYGRELSGRAGSGAPGSHNGVKKARY